MSKDDNLVNQALFLSMAYVTIVWLTEGFSRDEIAIAVEKKGGFQGFSVYEKDGKRIDKLSGKDYICRIRNALSHSTVEIEDKHFSFWGQGESKRESGRVVLTWEQLAKLSNLILFAVNDVLYPPAASAM